MWNIIFFKDFQTLILEKKEEKNDILYSLSHYHPHTSFIISLEKNIRKGEKKKKEKREKVVIIYKMRGWDWYKRI